MVTAASPALVNPSCVENAKWSDPVAYDLTRTETRVSVPEEKKTAVPTKAGVYAICAGASGKDVSDFILDIGECGLRPSSRRGLRGRLASAVAHSASERIAKDIKNGKLRDALFVVWAEAASKQEAKEAQDALICLFRREFGRQPHYNRISEYSSRPDNYVALYERLRALVVGDRTRVLRRAAGDAQRHGAHGTDANRQLHKPPIEEASAAQVHGLQRAEQVSEKLKTLSAERLGEVEDFIDFLSHRDSERQLTRMAMAASEPVLSAVWDNPDDAEYDAL